MSAASPIHTLQRQGLLQVDTPALVARYNECLEHMGIAPTTLDCFTIDRVGWSPEIADATGDRFYLSPNAGNVAGIILSVDQRHAPLLTPYFSFDAYLLDQLYQDFARQVHDITTETGICLAFEAGISSFREPFDLLLIGSYVLLTETPKRLSLRAKRQLSLINEFLSSDTAWTDAAFRQQLIESASADGDLRDRNVSLSPLVFEQTNAFYSRAFGGMYIIKRERHGRGSSRRGPDVVVIYADPSLQIESRSGIDVRHVHTANLADYLFKQGILTIDESIYQADPNKVAHKLDHIFYEFICNRYPSDFDIESVSRQEKKRLISQHADEFPAYYFDLERYHSDLLHDRTLPPPESARLQLAEPADKRSAHTLQVVGRLLSEMDPTDLRRLHRYNPDRFFADYPNWTDTKKRWVATLLSDPT